MHTVRYIQIIWGISLCDIQFTIRTISHVNSLSLLSLLTLVETIKPIMVNVIITVSLEALHYTIGKSRY